jgi:MFS family permease
MLVILIFFSVQMTTSILTAAFAISDFIAAPLCAWYVDHYRSRLLPWNLGLVMVITGGVLFGVAQNFTTLLLSRLFQGAASAILYTVGLAVLVENVSKDEVGQYMGSAMSANNFGIILSPLLGGALYDRAGKKAVFGLMMGIAGVDIVMRLLMRDGKPQRSSCSRDVDQKVKGVVELDQLSRETTIVSNHVTQDEKTISRSSSQTFPLNPSQKTLVPQIEEVEMPPSPTPSLRPTTTSTAIAPPQLSTLPSTQPTVQPNRFKGVLRLIRSPRLLAALYGCFINETITTSLCAVLPLYAHHVFNWSSLFTGLLFLTLAIPGLAGPLAGMLGDKLGPKYVAVAGFLATAPALMGLMVVDQNKTGDIVELVVLLTLVGSTVIFFLSPLGADLSHVADEMTETLEMDMFASSFSLMNSALAAAGVLGPLLVGWVRDEFGWKPTCVLLGVLCLSGAIPCVSVLSFIAALCFLPILTNEISVANKLYSRRCSREPLRILRSGKKMRGRIEA